MEKVIFQKFLHKKMTILLQKIEFFQNLPLFLAFWLSMIFCQSKKTMKKVNFS